MAPKRKRTWIPCEPVIDGEDALIVEDDPAASSSVDVPAAASSVVMPAAASSVDVQAPTCVICMCPLADTDDPDEVSTLLCTHSFHLCCVRTLQEHSGGSL